MSILTRVKTGTLMQRWRRVTQLRRSRGSARVVYAFLRRLVELPLIRRSLHLCALEFWRLPLSESRSPPRSSSLFSVRFAQAGDVTDIAQYFGDRQRVEDRLARGDQCVIAICQGSIGAAVWLAIGPSHFAEDWDELRCAFRFPFGIAWSYDGKGTKLGAWGTMMKQLPSLLRDKDVREIATIIDCNNWQSTDAHRSLGYQSAGVLLHTRILGFTAHLLKPPKQRWRRFPATVTGIELMKAGFEP